jgi:hypothetical protein
MPVHSFVRPLLAAALMPLALAASACDSTNCSCSDVVIQCRRAGSWWVAVSTNFQVCSLRSSDDAKLAAERCEKVRASLLSAWQFSKEGALWRPRCHVILYPDARSYVAAVGRGSEVTVGSSLVKPRTGTITSRRIDLRSDVPRYLDAALPHEMCHLLVADQFRDHPAPLWYDEGLALLVDPPEKLRLHERDLRNGLRLGTAFRISEMLSAERYPEPHRMGVFYGQCAALTQLLLNERQPSRIHEFASQISAVGVNPALQASYGIGGVAELERRWARHDYSLSSQPVASRLPTYVYGEQVVFRERSKIDAAFVQVSNSD